MGVAIDPRTDPKNNTRARQDGHSNSAPTTVGRKSGKKRIHPLGYFEFDGGYVVIGSNGGSNSHPDWFHNLRSDPHALIQIEDKEFEALAEIASLTNRDQLWRRLIEVAPFYARYAKKTKRKIPLVILRPGKM